jgi:hypothetical protein
MPRQPTNDEMKARALDRWENEGGALASERHAPGADNPHIRWLILAFVGTAVGLCVLAGIYLYVDPGKEASSPEVTIPGRDIAQ